MVTEATNNGREWLLSEENPDKTIRLLKTLLSVDDLTLDRRD